MLIFIFLFSSQSHALIQVRDLMEPTTRFYRSTSSHFPSGVAAINVLQEKQIHSRLETWYLVEGVKSKFWVPDEDLYFLRDFYQQNTNEQSGLVTETTKILRFKKGWRPDGKLKQGAYLTIHSMRSDWACGIDEKGELCVPSDKLLLAIDTAKKIQTDNGSWHFVKYRYRHRIISEKNEVIPISKVKTWEASPHIAFVRPNQKVFESYSNTGEKLNSFEKVILRKKEIRKWNQSFLSEHGNIWWQNLSETTEPDPAIILTKEEVLNRNLFDLSQSKKSSLISADGIFFSNDGETWTFLRQFGETNYPVTLGPKNTLIVGDQLSFDEGKTFQNFIRWDQVALIAQRVLKHPPGQLRLQEVKLSGGTTLKLKIDTGYKILVFFFFLINSQLYFLNTHLKK